MAPVTDRWLHISASDATTILTHLTSRFGDFFVGYMLVLTMKSFDLYWQNGTTVVAVAIGEMQ